MPDEFLSFSGLSSEYTSLEQSKFIVLPLPYEKTTSYLKGTARGPQAILSASCHVELYDEELRMETYKKGIHTIVDITKSSELDFNAPPQEFIKQLANYSKRFIQPEKSLISLGGEHTISFGLVKSHQEVYPELSVLQLDAHADLYNEYEGLKYSHASVIRRIAEICSVVQVGIRSLPEEYLSLMKNENQSLTRFYAHEMKLDQRNKYINKILSALSQDVYITIDVDVFDPAVIPAVGTPEPGGLNWYEVLDILRPVFQNKNVVGFDLVELCPIPHSVISEFTIAKLAYRLMGYALFPSLDPFKKQYGFDDSVSEK